MTNQRKTKSTATKIAPSKSSKRSKVDSLKLSTVGKNIWPEKKLFVDVNRYYKNVCSDDKIKLMLSVLKSGTMRSFRKKVKSDPFYKHFSALYGKCFDPFKRGSKFTYTFKTGKKLTTSLSQLMFFKWFLTYDIFFKYFNFGVPKNEGNSYNMWTKRCV